MSLADLDHSSSEPSPQDGAADDPQAATPGDDAAGVPDMPAPAGAVGDDAGVPGAERDDDAPVPIYEEIVAELGDPTAPPAADASDA